MHVVQDMLAHPDAPLPILSRIVEAPVFAADGALVTVPGYHEGSRTYYAPRTDFNVPAIPTAPAPEDIERARNLLVQDLLGDFPFTSDAERAHALAFLLLPFVRELIGGPTPLHLVEKPSPGTGASLLVEVLAFPAAGHPTAVLTEGRNEEEWRKRITAKLASAPAITVIDN